MESVTSLLTKIISRFVSISLCYLFIGGGYAACSAFAKSTNVGVVYPDIREPYRSVFRNIVDGIQEDKAYRTIKYVLAKDEQVSRVTDWLEKDNIEVVVALGSRGLETAWEFPDTVKVIFGAVLIPPVSFPRNAKGITLTPDPRILFSSLKTLAPHVKRVTVVYNPDNFEWLITLARAAAQSLSLELNYFPVKTFRDAAYRYREFFEQHSVESDSIWLLQDPSVIDERTILQLILEEAWEKKLVVFSSNPSHVKRGILFSLYPDNKSMGRSLADIVRSAIQDQDQDYPQVSPVGDLLSAVNLRTAEHLGIKLSRSQKRKFTLAFPMR